MERADWIGAPEGLTRIDGTGVTAPDGFRAAGVAAGLKGEGLPDLGLLVSDRPAQSALVDTPSALPSAAVTYTRSLHAGSLRGVVVNSGCANAATGEQGIVDARAMGEAAAAAAAVPVGSLAVCSTGVIGERLPMKVIAGGIDAAAAALSPDGGPEFGEAIRTTDAFAKGGTFRLALSGGDVTIGAAAKGAGMIRPDMATMLAYVTTDACVLPDDLLGLTRAAAAGGFNRISVDGQMSPSDTLLVLANGEGPPLEGDDLARFGDALRAICRYLAILMVKDGEGAEHAVRVVVEGALDDDEAERVVRAVGESALVRTAAYGRDANWGRVHQAVGQALARAGGHVDFSLRFDGMLPDGAGIDEVMARPEYEMQVGLGRGD
ncbi:MAG: bifunctional ornithine acetyltransferase/N-acetylglutamate synthase, partial [Acidobacteria bacterium]|nr:bifunctional ornithine acetyltransferase/N-acetylglutamate synthase [Acidobacteriota bacterium]